MAFADADSGAAVVLNSHQIAEVNVMSHESIEGLELETTELRTAVVTGASRGIGSAIADDLLSRNWRVIGVARKFTPGIGGQLHKVVADLSAPGGVEECAHQISALTDRVDLLVNNAGQIYEKEDVLEVTEETMLAGWRLHVWAPLLLTR